MVAKDEHVTEEEKTPQTETVHHEEKIVSRSQSKAPLIGIAVALGLIILLVGAGSGFLAGVAVGRHVDVRGTLQSPLSGGQSGPAYQGQGGFQNNRGVSRNFANTTGTVTAVSSNSITVKTARGTTVTYNITSSTTVDNNGSSASVSDIKVGDTVSVRQTADTTGDAASIQLNP